MQRRTFLASALAAAPAPLAAADRQWPLGIKTYCLRFQRWPDKQLIDYCAGHRLDAIFLQDSLEAGVMDPQHRSEVRAWTRDAGLHLETGGGAILPARAADWEQSAGTLRKNIRRAAALGSPIVRALLASDRYAMPPGPVEQRIETTVRILRAVRSEVMDAGLKIGIENHKELMAWQTRELIETAARSSSAPASIPATRCSWPRTR